MSEGKLQKFIPFVLLLVSGGIAGWTAFVVHDNHEISTFEDTPQHVPVINVVIGAMSVIIFLINLFRVLKCINSEGCCNTGLGWFNFIIMFGLGVWLFVAGTHLSKTERDMYRNNYNYYFELSIGQAVYMVVYCMIVLVQWFCIKCKCCNSCAGSNDYSDSQATFYA